jgi:putative salt-induced outer membrane protein YdiY
MSLKNIMVNKSIILFGMFLIMSIFSWSQNDTIVLKNDNIIVGEIKLMDQGFITMKTPYSGKDFKIKWRNLKKISTEQTFVVSLSNGKRFNSVIMAMPDTFGKAIIFDINNPIEIELKNIVYLKPINSSFFSKMRFSNIAVGYNYTKSNKLSQLNINSTLYYTTFKWMLTGIYNSVISNQTDVDETKRIDASINLKYFMKKDWFYAGEVDFLSNDEQKLKLRTTFSGGIGKYLIHSNVMAAGVGGGLAYTNERYSDNVSPDKNSLEAYLSVQYNIYDFKDINLATLGTFYPSLTESGRYRFNFTASLSYDLPLDFFIQLSYTLNYDSQPVEGASANDYVYQTTFGWKFK